MYKELGMDEYYGQTLHELPKDIFFLYRTVVEKSS